MKFLKSKKEKNPQPDWKITTSVLFATPTLEYEIENSDEING